MKPLLSKTTKPFIIYVLIVLTISIPVYYFVVDFIWQEELDEHNIIVAEKTSYEFNKTNISAEEIQQNITLWNKIQPGTNIERIHSSQIKPDTIFTEEKLKPFSADKKIERYRCLRKVIYIKNVPYLFTIETNIEETKDTVMIIGIVTGFFFILIVVGLFILNRRLSKTIWEPFRDTLGKLKKFNLNTNNQINFNKTDTIEFEELNESLRKLIDHSVSVFKGQKEFTENASHELQTPLAIIKNKLDILLQSKDLTDEHYAIIEEINIALSRSSRINKNLLLLAKIENSQFNIVEMDVYELIDHSVENLEEHINQKSIVFSSDMHKHVKSKGNISLTEILINNLLINAIKHTHQGGNIHVKLESGYFMVSNSGTESLNPELIFTRFKRFSNDNSGSGLGLAIIKEICRFQNWEINYDFKNNFHHFSVKF
ncbi:HAMP domain-containing histidine kinase [Chryseobacterium sp. Ch-15]|uniref:histidine kinase n=2 Tax=Chryseobacterium TaxID=59732 RepID=A0A9Q3UYK2_9FLAO|nr:HAMP domain-containing sensor histidine kinase [Chryseobacterium muglaense]MBD3906265.1 HAMP domain-containing histidine kinase [Chryseobacterium muglaense]MCC9036762.1 HAMP domain-containing histidine kinase [Chryseobacterium muglaense]MCM2555285.1 HAMP domain-containing histidine kinase [Chryseobacterium muglaense]